MEQREFWKNEKIAFLAMTTLRGVGFWTLHKIAQSGFGFKEILKSPDTKYYEKIISHDERNNALPDVQEEIWGKGLLLARELQKENIKLIFKEEEGFPDKLKRIPDAPEWIFIQGAVENLNAKSIAIVGTRKPTEDGMFLTRLVLSCLSGANYITVSGLALGIDQLAHIDSLRYHLPTIAVLGTGIKENYPRGSETLRAQILDSGGSIVTEYLPHQSYSSENFVRRNRIQAALCDTLIPVEWNIKSGTAHTVGFSSKYEKKIANVYLPGTYNSRPELTFSEEQYGAISYELPRSIAEFLEFIKEDKLPPKSIRDDLGSQFNLDI
ncbi:DNA-processing protein DprA [Pseudomonas sp. RL_15y_Pfl2_60]|uniref:DNA-processing protein DprA n=1 Tax=Pseudomonas sp. RL_15y_Pfl2_60 TaxID=3088709 RepID=UPI0030DCD004